MGWNPSRLKWAAACIAALAAQPVVAGEAAQDGGWLVPGLSLSTPDGRRMAVQPLPEVPLTGEMLFQILASEIAAQRGAAVAATRTSVELARITRDPRLARRAVEFALSGGDLVRALEAAQAWAELDPADFEARQTVLSLSASAGRVEGLGSSLRARIASVEEADKPAAIADARRVVARLPDRKRALEVLEEALSDVRTHPAARYAMARGAAAAGDMPRALREVRAAQAAQPDDEGIAMLALQVGLEVEPDAAVAGARAFIATHPEVRDLRVLLVRALQQRRDYAGARSELDGMARANPEDFDVLYMRGLVEYRAGQLGAADEALQQYLTIEAQRAEGTDGVPMGEAANARMLRVQIAEDQGRLEDAIALLDRIDDPDEAFGARLRQAVLEGRLGRLDDARRRIAVLDPRTFDEGVQAALTEAQILRAAGRRDDAVAVLEQGHGRHPDSPSLMYDLSMLYEQQDRIDDMERMLRRVIAVKPDHAHAYNALGYSLADRNQRLPEARSLIERGLALAPDDPFILDSMGWVLYRQGQPAKAIPYLRRAYELRPDSEIGIHLGEVLWANGQRSEARDIWRKVQREDPDSDALRSTLRRLAVML